MKVTYIEHSCFSVELDKAILLFDYYNGKLPTFDNNKTIYVFSSHSHHDHFDFSIFGLLKEYSDVRYIFSKDVKRRFNEKFFHSQGVEDTVYRKIEFVGANEILTLSDLKIETLTSTDEGVAFIVTVDGKSIYHAGDLNLWVWEGESEQDNKNMTVRFETEMMKIKNRHFDMAFLVLDPRQEELFSLGFDYFMKNTDTDCVYPMHFWKDNSVIERLKTMRCSETYRDKIVDIHDYF